MVVFAPRILRAKDGPALTEPLQVRQFAIVDHEPVDRGPNAGIFTGRGPAEDRAELYLVAEGTTPAGEGFAGHIVSAAGQSWQTLDLSVTGALRRIVMDADTSLRDWNRKSIAQHRVSLGMTAVARKSDQVILAQAGPSVAFHRKADRTDIYYTDEEHGAPMGSGARSEPQLTRLEFAPGDRLLLLSTAALGEVDDRLVSEMLGLPPAQLLANIYRRVGGLRHVTAVLIAAGDVDPAMLPAAQEDDYVIGSGEPLEDDDDHDASSFQPSLFIQGRAGYDVETARRNLGAVSARVRARAPVLPPVLLETPAPLQLAVGSDVRSQIEAYGRTRGRVIEMSSSLAGTRLLSGRATMIPAEPIRRNGRGRKAESFARSLVRGEPAPLPPAPATNAAPLAGEMADEFRARAMILAPVAETIATENIVSIAPGETLVQRRAAMSGRWHGSGLLTRRRTASGTLPPTWMIVAVGLAVLMLAVAIIALPRALDSNNDDRLASLLDNAAEKLATSRAVTDAAKKREALTEAQASLLEARDLSGGATEVTRLLLEVTESIATLDAVRAPARVDILASLEQFGEKPVTAVRLAVGADSAYLLDSASSQVIAVSLANGEHRVVYAENKDAKRGRPLAIAVYEAPDFGQPLLLVADASHNLWGVDASGAIRSLTVSGVKELTDITVTGRDLYVLDAAASAIVRLSPAEGGFQGPVKVLDSPDLAGGQRLAVDGEEIFTADGDGRLHRFAGKFALTLSQGGIDQPLTLASSPWPLGKAGGVAFLDAPADRIVVLRLDGAFDHQFRHASFASATAFAIYRGQGYLFSGGKLRRITWQ